MKKKFDFKLTISLVSLFVSLIVLISCNRYKTGLFVGFLLLGISIIFYGYSRVALLNSTIKKTNEELDEELVDIEVFDEVVKELNRVKKMKRSTSITFYLAGGLLIFCSFLMLI